MSASASINRSWFRRYWFHLVFAGLIGWLALQKRIHITIEVTPRHHNLTTTSQRVEATLTPQALQRADRHEYANETSAKASTSSSQISSTPSKKKWTADDFSNLTFVLDPSYAQRNGVPQDIVQRKLDHCKRYIERFARVAIAEMHKFGVPASITLAQALLESDAGSSQLAVESNNHFGIKCRSKCLSCTCRNYADDDRYDMFRVFQTAWESFRAHSQLMHDSRYQHLLKLGKDYRKWAKGLEDAGYATDPQYAEKLVQIIEFFDLYLFDHSPTA